MARVVENIFLLASAHARHHVGHHGTQTRPWHHLAGADAGEAGIDPIHQRLDAIGANVFVDAIEFGRARHAEAVHAQAAGDQLGFIVQQTHLGRRLLALCIQQIHGDGIALDRVDIDTVAQLARKLSAGHAGAHHQAVEVVRLRHAVLLRGHGRSLAIRGQVHHILPHQKLHAQTLTGLGQARGEAVNVTGRVALGVVAAIKLARQGGLDGLHFLRRDGTARQAALGQQLGHLASMLKALGIAVNVQDALFFQVELDAFLIGPGKEVLTCLDGQARGFNGVLCVLGNAGNELGKPRQLVPAGFRVDQQGRIAFQHPFQAFDQGGRMGPDFGVRGRQLATVGKRGLHGGIALLFKQRHRKAFFGQRISGCHTRDAATNHCHRFHHVLQTSWGSAPGTPCA